MTRAPVPVGLQLYTVRDALNLDLEGTARRVADIGYAGVEPFGLNPDSAPAMRDLCDDLGLAIPIMHVPMPISDRRAEAIGTVLAQGTSRISPGG